MADEIEATQPENLSQVNLPQPEAASAAPTQVEPVASPVASGYQSPDFPLNSNDLTINKVVDMSNASSKTAWNTKLFEKWWTWLVVCAVLVGLAVGGWYWSRGKSVVIQSNGNAFSASVIGNNKDYQASNLSGWVKYTDSDTAPHTSFDYDSNWALTNAPSEADVTAFYGTNGYGKDLNYGFTLANGESMVVTASLDLANHKNAPVITADPSAAPTFALTSENPYPSNTTDTYETKSVTVAGVAVNKYTSLQKGKTDKGMLYQIQSTRTIDGIEVSFLIRANATEAALSATIKQNLQDSFDKLFSSITIK